MSGTKTVHECLFCSQTFGSATEKDDHILEHFAQETCADCDQSLIRIGSNLYTIHNTVTCIKRELKKEFNHLHENHGEQNRSNHNEKESTTTSSNTIYDQEVDIKNEPEIQIIDTIINDPRTSLIENCEENINRNHVEDVTSMNTVSVHQVEIKLEPGIQAEEFLSEDMEHFTETDDINLVSNQLFQSKPQRLVKSSEANKQDNYQHKCDICKQKFSVSTQLRQHKKYKHSSAGTDIKQFECEICKVVVQRKESLQRHMKTKHDPNYIRFKCDFCWNVFVSKKSLENHIPHCKRPKKSNYNTENRESVAQNTLCTEQIQVEQTQFVDTKNETETNNMIAESIQLLPNHHIDKLPETSIKTNYKYDRVPCDICGKIVSTHWLEKHKKYKQCDPKSRQLFQSKEKLTKKSTNKSYDRIPCDICGEKIHLFWLKKHKKKKHNAPEDQSNVRFECKICYRVVATEKNLRLHMRLKHDPNCKKFKCNFCSVVLLSKQSLDNHHLFRCKRNKNSMNYPIGSDIVSTESVKIEKETKENDKVSCEICGRILASKYNVKLHKIMVHKIGGHHCIYCKSIFHTAEGLINHGRKCTEKLNQTFECYICHKNYCAKSNLRIHIRSIHISFGTKYKCDMCEKSFNYKSDYERHKNKIHLNLNIRNFMCSTCGKAFRSGAILKRHEYSHTEEMPFKCTYEECNKSFRYRDSLDEHLRRHQGLKRYQCKIDGCNEQFGGILGFKRHKFNVHGIAIT